MKKLFRLLCSCFMPLMSLGQGASNEIAIIPQPVSINKTAGEFVLPQNVSIQADQHSELKQVVATLTDHFTVATGVQVVITTGGTGITSRDSTYEAVASLLEKRLDGFGELFRMLSYQEIGAAAMMSRATAGLAHGCIVATLPGSESAVRLAMEKLLIPELGHLVQQAAK